MLDSFENIDEAMKEAGMGGGGSKFWSPQMGQNKVRMISGFKIESNHYDKVLKQYFYCVGKLKGCAYCLKNETLSKSEKVSKTSRFLCWILLRDAVNGDSVKVGKFPFTVYGELKKLRVSGDWNFEKFPHYDINISRTGEKQNTEYSVSPSNSMDPLTAEQLAEFEKAKEGFSIETYVEEQKAEAMATITPKVEEPKEPENKVPFIS